MQRLQKVKLVVGLGNPGQDYKDTYHNAGFSFVDYLEKNRQIFNFQFSIFKILKSDTYMNESGRFVKRAMKKFGAKPEELLVAHDDSDIEIGSYKFSYGRNSAGHKGVESIIGKLGTKNFWRLRIGIRPISRMGHTATGLVSRNKPRRVKASEFVLKKISKSDSATLDKVFEKASKSVP